MRTVVLLAAAILIFFLIRYLQRQPRKVLFQLAAVVGGVGLIVLAATGRLHWIVAAIGAALPFMRRLLLSLAPFLPLLQRFASQYRTGPTAASPSSGRTSEVTSRYLRMSLNHDTGEMEGEILEGQFRGKRLSALGQNELMYVFNDLMSQDKESADLMQAYLDRTYGEAWYEWAESGRAHTKYAANDSGDMSQEEALRILGLKPGAGEDEIIEAHRRLMQRLHPDRGGSDYLAAKINQAKDVLLG